MKIIFGVIGMMSINILFAQNNSIKVEDYIEYYGKIAVTEMERSGIPASIKLAQGIHESAYGNSTLAKEANNHFGIKCGSGWKGKTYYKWDDEARESCFRVYSSGDESYIEHTEFLANRKHYAFLFEYPRTDYKNWAKGLRKAGYATDPKYPDKLISTIEKYNLSRFDTLQGQIAFDQPEIVRPVPTPPPPTPPKVDSSAIFVRPKQSPRRTKELSFLFVEYKKGIFRQNDASYVIAQKGESALSVATRFGIPYAKLLKFNDLEDGDLLIDYQYVYIQPKKNNYTGDSLSHIVASDETMYELAQYYGIKLENLLELNALKLGQEPLNGSTISLKQKQNAAPKLRAANHVDILPDREKQEPKPTPSTPKTDNNQNNTTNPLGENNRINKDWEYSDDDIMNYPINVKDTTSRTQIVLPYKETPKPTPQQNPNPFPTIKEEPDPGALFPPRQDPSPQPNIDDLFPAIKEEPAPQPNIDPAPTPVPSRPIPNAQPSTQTKIYVVQAGDSLTKIAKLHNVTIAAIKSANNLSTDNIRIGQKIIIP